MDKTELRLDPLTEAWTIFSTSHPTPPSSRSVIEEHLAPSPFTAGNEKFVPRALYSSPKSEGAGWQVRVTPNRAPILQIEGDPHPQSDGFYDRMDGIGAHEIVVEEPGSGALETLPLRDIEKVLVAWKVRMLDLMKDIRMRSFTIVKNVGIPAGARTSHSVSQLVAMAIVPPLLGRKLQIARSFFAARKRSIFSDILREEVRTGTRLVYENNGFTAFCPYASRAPFEIAIYPKRQCADFHGVSDQEITQLADTLKTSLAKLNRALDHPPYNLMLFTAPTRTPRRDHWTTIDADFRWHIEILPRIYLRGGVELGTGCWMNSIWPETAADYLRGITLSE